MMRRLWVQVHLWLGLSFGAVGILIGITGSLLVFDRALDAQLNPQRYALTGDSIALPYATYFANATQALGIGPARLHCARPARRACRSWYWPAHAKAAETSGCIWTRRAVACWRWPAAAAASSVGRTNCTAR